MPVLWREMAFMDFPGQIAPFVAEMVVKAT